MGSLLLIQETQWWQKRKIYNFKHSLGYSGHNQITCLLISLLDLCASASRLSFQLQCELAS
jgi:hypothetical protein